MWWRPLGGHFHAIRVDRPADVLDRLLSERDEPRPNIGSNMVMDLLRKHYPARVRDALESRRNIDAVAVDVTVLNDNVAKVYTDAQANSVLVFARVDADAEFALDIDCALECANNA